MPWYLYIALRQLFPTGRRFPFFTLISILGVALGVAVLLITTSVMGGFGFEIRKMTVETQGDVQLRATGDMIGDWHAVGAIVDKVPGVVASTPFADGPAAFILDGKPAFPMVHGIDVDTVSKVIPLEKYISCPLDDLDDDTVILSRLLALSIGARIGDEVEVYSLRTIQEARNDVMLLPRKLKVVGTFEIGHQALDSTLVIVTLRRMQELYGMGQQVNGLNIKIEPNADADEVAARIRAAIPPNSGLRALSWMEINQEFLWVLQFEHNIMFFLLTFIIIVAAFSVTSSLLISVVRKTREIGLVGALGADRREVALCYCFQGSFIGVVGTLVGLGLGFTVLQLKDQILLVFTRLTASEAILERFYQFSKLPAHTAAKDVLAIAICSVVISTLAGLIPAWRAAALKPVDALRTE